jgi:hypothetical protein
MTEGAAVSDTIRAPASDSAPLSLRVSRLSILGPLLLLAIVIGFGSWLRLAGLGSDELAADELNHYFVGQSLERGEGPLLPSGERYQRGMDISRLVGWTSTRMSDAEAAARLPSAIFGIAGLLIFAAICWRIAGPWPAVWGALLLGIYPEAIAQSRFTRFYTYQMLFGLIALYGGWLLLRSSAVANAPDRKRRLEQWGGVLIASLALSLALRAQITTATVVLGLGAAIALAGVCDLLLRGRSALRTSVPVQVSLAGVVVLVLLLMTRSSQMDEMLMMAGHVPLWAGSVAGHPFTYYWALSGVFPLLISLAPAIFLIVAMRDFRLAVYLALWFAVPFLLHSFFLAWKIERYIFLAVPALLLATAVAASEVASLGYRTLRKRLPLRESIARFAAATAVAIVAFGAVITTPAFNHSRRLVDGRAAILQTSFREAGRIINTPEFDGIPVGSAEPLGSLLYWGRVDFTVQLGLLERRLPGADSRIMADGGPDLYSGVPVLTRPESIRAHFAERNAVLIAIDDARAHWDNVRPELLETLERETEELCEGRCPSMRLYLWKFGEDVGERSFESNVPTSDGLD